MPSLSVKKWFLYPHRTQNISRAKGTRHWVLSFSLPIQLAKTAKIWCAWRPCIWWLRPPYERQSKTGLSYRSDSSCFIFFLRSTREFWIWFDEELHVVNIATIFFFFSGDCDPANSKLTNSGDPLFANLNAQWRHKMFQFSRLLIWCGFALIFRPIFFPWMMNAFFSEKRFPNLVAFLSTSMTISTASRCKTWSRASQRFKLLFC